VRPPRLAEAPLQDLIRSLEEEHGDPQAAAAQARQLRLELGEEAALADVDDERGAADVLLVLAVVLFAFGADEPREGGEQSEREVIDAEVAEVFKGVDGRRHARPAEAGDDGHVGRGPERGRLRAVRAFSP
jgi:hypothetical protein